MKPLRIRDANHKSTIAHEIRSPRPESATYMIRTLLSIIARPHAREGILRQVTIDEPLIRLREVSGLDPRDPMARIAKALATQTSRFIEALVSDDAIPDWKSFGLQASSYQMRDLAIFCSTCILQRSLKEHQVTQLGSSVDAAVKSQLIDLLKTMYGDFACDAKIRGLTLYESLESGDSQEPDDAKHLARLLDGLISSQPHEKQSAARKIQKVQDQLREHRRAFVYTLHTAL